MPFTPFQKKVYSLTKKIPKGKVSTYQQLAKKLNTKAYRAVGQALKKNKDKKVPCHRVISSSGFIGGFAQGKSQKLSLLRKEGIIIKGNRIDLDKYKF